MATHLIGPMWLEEIQSDDDGDDLSSRRLWASALSPVALVLAPPTVEVCAGACCMHELAFCRGL